MPINKVDINYQIPPHAVDLSVPKLVEVEDYHELMEIKRYIGLVFEIKNLKIQEVAFNDDTGMYIGLVYYGRCPARKQIKDLVAKKFADEFAENDIHFTWER